MHRLSTVQISTNTAPIEVIHGFHSGYYDYYRDIDTKTSK